MEAPFARIKHVDVLPTSVPGSGLPSGIDGEATIRWTLGRGVDRSNWTTTAQYIFDRGELLLTSWTISPGDLADVPKGVNPTLLARAARFFPMAEAVRDIRLDIQRHPRWLAEYPQGQVPGALLAQVAANATGLHYEGLHPDLLRRGPGGFPDDFYRRLTDRRIALQGVRKVNQELARIATEEQWVGREVTVENVKAWLKEAKRRGIASPSGTQGDPSFKEGPKYHDDRPSPREPAPEPLPADLGDHAWLRTNRRRTNQAKGRQR